MSKMMSNAMKGRGIMRRLRVGPPVMSRTSSAPFVIRGNCSSLVTRYLLWYWSLLCRRRHYFSLEDEKVVASFHSLYRAGSSRLRVVLLIPPLAVLLLGLDMSV